MGHIQHLRHSGPLRWDGIKRERRPGTSREPEETTEYHLRSLDKTMTDSSPCPRPARSANIVQPAAAYSCD